MLKDHQDAFGHEVMAYLEGQPVIEIVERDDGAVMTTAGAAAYFAPFDEWHPIDREAMDYVRGRVLDIGSGAGRMALHLQDQGHEVICIDNSPLALEVCRRRGVENTELMSAYQVSRRLGAFDTILMMGGNLGLLADGEKGRRLLAKLDRITNPGARIVGTTRDPYDTDDPWHLQYHEFNRNRGRQAGQVRMRVRYRTYRSPWFDYLLQSPDEVRSMLTDTPWELKHTIPAEGGLYAAIIQK